MSASRKWMRVPRWVGAVVRVGRRVVMKVGEEGRRMEAARNLKGVRGLGRGKGG